ncbi:MAG: flagellar basal body P-ring formation protein FlgA [Leptospiraceae bacterium]|nr:flagellar basal body P-ring formation protein FlgA [Leptospiraceae bacterium]
MSNFVFLGILLWVFATPTLGKNNAVYLKTRVFLEKDTVLLSDIARLGKDVGDRIIVQKLDSPTQISANSLEQELNQDDSGISVYGKECLVVPMNAVYQKDELVESLYKEILSKSNLVEGDFKITYLGNSIILPSSGVELRWANFPHSLNSGYRIFSLDVLFNKSKIFTQRLKFLIEKKITLPIAKRDIPKDTIISKDDFEYKSQFLSDLDQGFATHDITGYTALVNIASDTVIKKKQVKKMFMVEKGEEVDIVYTKGGLVVKGKGRARQSGNVGDTIQVTGHGGRNILKVRVASKGVVVIE